MEKVKQAASTKLRELYMMGYILQLGGDGSYGNRVSVKLEKDGEQFLFAVEDNSEFVKRDVNKRSDFIDLYTTDITLRRMRSDFPSKDDKDLLYCQKFYLLNGERWDNGYYTDDRVKAIQAAEIHYHRLINRQVKDKSFVCSNERLLASVHKHKGFKRAKEVVVTKRNGRYGYKGREYKYYTVSYDNKSYEVWFKE